MWVPRLSSRLAVVAVVAVVEEAAEVEEAEVEEAEVEAPLRSCRSAA